MVLVLVEVDNLVGLAAAPQVRVAAAEPLVQHQQVVELLDKEILEV